MKGMNRMAERAVLVLGGGIGGVVAAGTLRRILPAGHRVVMVERSDRHVFWPSLPWLMTGTRKPEDVQRDLSPLAQRGIEIVYGDVTAFDPMTQVAAVGDQRIKADATVVSLGADLVPGLVPGLSEGGYNVFSLVGAERFHESLRELRQGHVVVLVSAIPFKCPAAPYEIAFLIDHYLRKNGRRDAVEVSVYTAEDTPMAVAGASVSNAVVDFLRQRQIPYHPGAGVVSVDALSRRLRFTSGEEADYTLLAFVPPHAVPPVLIGAGLAKRGGWVTVDPETCETPFRNVFAIGDATGVPLTMGKPLPKAGVFAHAQAEAVAHTIASRLLGQGAERRFDGNGECFLELGDGKAAFARGNFYAQPTPNVRLYRPGRHWHAGKVALERMWWKHWVS